MDALADAAVHSTEIPAHPGYVRPASEWLQQACATEGVPVEHKDRLELCLNEIIANVIAHGGESAQAQPMTLQLTVRMDGGSGEATLVVVDSGMEFNPFDREPATTAVSLREAEPGGLGLLMLQRFSDRRAYRRFGARNELSLTVCWPFRRG